MQAEEEYLRLLFQSTTTDQGIFIGDNLTMTCQGIEQDRLLQVVFNSTKNAIIVISETVYLNNTHTNCTKKYARIRVTCSRSNKQETVHLAIQFVNENDTGIYVCRLLSYEARNLMAEESISVTVIGMHAIDLF